jgi:type IV pilus assembly protein PilM
MGLEIKKLKNLPIGVDLGSSSIKMAQLRASENSFELLAAARVEIPGECRDDHERRFEFQCDKIRGILAAGAFKGREAILSLPAAATFLQPVRIPIVPQKQIDLAVKNELQGKLPYPEADAVIRHILAGTVYPEGRDMQERIVVAILRSDLEAYLAMAQRAGLQVVGVNIEACAIVECFARVLRRASDESCVTLFIDMGAASTQVALAHSQKIVFASNLPMGGHSLDEEVAEALHIPVEQAHQVRRNMIRQEADTAAEDELYGLLEDRIAGFADKMTQCVRYHESVFRNRPIERVIFVGGQAHDKRLCQSIAKRLHLPAQVGDPIAGIKRVNLAGGAFGLDGRQPNPSWAVAVGLSLGATLAA